MWPAEQRFETAGAHRPRVAEEGRGERESIEGAVGSTSWRWTVLPVENGLQCRRSVTFLPRVCSAGEDRLDLCVCWIELAQIVAVVARKQLAADWVMAKCSCSSPVTATDKRNTLSRERKTVVLMPSMLRAHCSSARNQISPKAQYV